MKVLFSILTITFQITKSFSSKIETFQIGSSQFQSYNIEVNIETKNRITKIEEYYIQSDVISSLPPNKSFELNIVQGFINENEYLNIENQKNLEKLDNFDNNSQSGISFFSSNFSPINDSSFEVFWQFFSNFFHILSYPILEKSNYIVSKNFFFTNEILEKPCSDILDGIKNMYPKYKWNEFESDIDYSKFVNSNFKSIYMIISKSGNENESIFHMRIRVLYKLNDMGLYNKKSQNNQVINRLLFGDIFGFSPFTIKGLIHVKKNTNQMTLYELIPCQLDLIISSFYIKIIYNNEIYNNLSLYTIEIHRNTEYQNPNILFNYELKTSVLLKLDFHMKELSLLFKNDFEIEYSYQLRKNLLNFESIENEYEFGYKIPSGILVLSNDNSKNNEIYVTTNQLFFNIPTVDNTMPFIIIALTFVVYGYIFIQLLNKYLKKKDQMIVSVLKKIKSKIENLLFKLSLPFLLFKRKTKTKTD